MRQATRRLTGRRQLAGYLLALLGSGAIVGLRAVLGGSFAHNPALNLFLIPVMLSAYVGGLAPGLFATALVAVVTRWFFLVPLRDLALERPGDELRWLVLVGGSLLVCALTEALQRARWRAELALREEAALRAQVAGVAASMPGLLSTFRLRPDGTGDMPYNSPRFREIYGIDPALVVHDAAPLLALIDPEDAPAVSDSLIESGRTMKPWHVRYRIHHPERGVRWLETWSMPTREADGSLLWSGYVVDVTDRIRLEQALREGEERLTLALEATRTGVWEWNVDSNAVFWSSMCFAITGVDNFAGDFAAFARLLHPDDAERVTDAIQGAVAARSSFQAEFRIVRPDGEVRWLHNLGRTECDGEGRPRRMIGTVRDITEAKRAEESRLRSQKLEALGTLSGGIAHDFNNILLAINGNARLAAADLPPHHPAQESLAQIARAGTRAADLVRQIVAFSRAEAPRRERIDVGAVVGEAIQLVRSILPPLVEVSSHAEPGLPPVVADSTQVHEVVVNLATNAADAIGPAGGRIEFRLDAVALDDAHADRALGLPPGRYVRLQARDTGHGMAPAVVERIFDPFYTTKGPGGGTGLGLSVVHGIVAGCGGAIAVDTAPGQGTTFRIYLPAAARERAAAAPRPAPAARGAGERVLYVDDDEMLVVLISRVLGKLGYQVSGYRDPTQALRDLRANPDLCDAVVTDLSMPGMSGIRLARELLALRPDLPVLMTTGYVRAGDEAAVREAGVRALILKPNTVDELGSALDAVLRGQRAAPAAAAVSSR
ncbi:PAS domain-containing protein [bacterium]|nr:PAS domain-containing protein [bacterium]